MYLKFCSQHCVHLLQDIHIPCSCRSMLEFVSDKKNGCTVDTCILLLLKVVEMVQHFHELSFVLGDIRASLIYVENKDGDFKLYPVSLQYLCDKTGQNFTSNQLKPPYQCVTFIRAAPEFKENGVCNASTDIFNIGALMMDVFAALSSGIEFQNEDCLNYIPLADIMESEISAAVFTKPLQCPTTLFHLIQN
ncbi:unnamed protein product [Lymnaea stagnalis]|uniref:Protein kinase domain-containing protein n=1 Tax=Lymnaea stagnalis TaxID=6523 RepID=A0AAV2HYP1_LYMST